MRRSRFSGSKRRLAAKDDDGVSCSGAAKKGFEVKGNRGAANERERGTRRARGESKGALENLAVKEAERAER